MCSSEMQRSMKEKIENYLYHHCVLCVCVCVCGHVCVCVTGSVAPSCYLWIYRAAALIMNCTRLQKWRRGAEEAASSQVERMNMKHKHVDLLTHTLFILLPFFHLFLFLCLFFFVSSQLGLNKISKGTKRKY